MMKKFILSMSAVFLLLLTLSNESFAIDLNIGDLSIGTGTKPPPFQMSGQPELMPIPGRYVYFVSDIDVDIFFYHGKWYRPYKDHWFRSGSYNGPWDRIRDVPDPLQDLPADYRSSIPRGYFNVPYDELSDNWERWEREKYWDRSRDEERERLGRHITPPPFLVSGQPNLFPIPGRYVYYISDINVDIFFFHGKWYRPYKDRWFRSGSYNGPWDRIRDVPAPLQDLPDAFRRVPYSELRDNWEKWERDKYWDRKRDDDRERHREERDRDRH